MIALLLASCGARPASNGKSAPRALTVFAAASLTEAFNELGAQFEAAHPGVKVQTNYAGSQQLAQQLAQGASADIFASADQEKMQSAIRAGRVAEQDVRALASNKLVVIYPWDNPGKVYDLHDLARPGLRLILVTEAAPAGHYSQEFLGKAAQDGSLGTFFKRGVLANVVSYEENVRALVSKVVLGEVDAGIAYTSDVSGTQADMLGRLEIPDHLNVAAMYFIAPVVDSSSPHLARQFVELATSDAGQITLARYGFLPVPATFMSRSIDQLR
jgi:molybdate transport system substrate-binding protein